MAKKKPKKTSPAKKPEEIDLKPIYDKIRREFSAADLAEYANIDEDECVPIEDVLAQVAAINRKFKAKRA